MLRLFHIVLVLGNRVKILKLPLYSIQFLHQITTHIMYMCLVGMLYSIQFLHQITTFWARFFKNGWLYSIQFLHQITTILVLTSLTACCIVSNFYIKSQPQVLHLLIIRVLHPYVPRKSDVRRTEEVDSMQFFRSAKQIYQKNSSC